LGFLAGNTLAGRDPVSKSRACGSAGSSCLVGWVASQADHNAAPSFADERGRLEGQWDQGGDVSTEDLRTAFQRYRLFFERLLTT
jgi:hypothetical protein